MKNFKSVGSSCMPSVFLEIKDQANKAVELNDQLNKAKATIAQLSDANQKEWLCPVEVPPASETEMYWLLHQNGYIEMVRFNNYTKYGGWRDTWQDLKHDDIEMKGTKYAVINKPEEKVFKAPVDTDKIELINALQSMVEIFAGSNTGIYRNEIKNSVKVLAKHKGVAQ